MHVYSVYTRECVCGCKVCVTPTQLAYYVCVLFEIIVSNYTCLNYNSYSYLLVNKKALLTGIDPDPHAVFVWVF